MHYQKHDIRIFIYLLYYKHCGSRQISPVIRWRQKTKADCDWSSLYLIDWYGSFFNVRTPMLHHLSMLPLYIKWQWQLYGQPTFFLWWIGKPIKNHVNFCITWKKFMLVSKMANYAVSVYMLFRWALALPLDCRWARCQQTNLVCSTIIATW